MADSDKSQALADRALLTRIADALERLAPPAIAGEQSRLIRFFFALCHGLSP